jgi:eukaryotic-like serine/threonine-protein kinase
VVLGGGATALALGLSGSDRGAACDAEAAKVRALFGPAERAALQAAFTKTGSPMADGAFQRAATALERTATALANQRAALCRGVDEPVRVVSARAQCLSEHEQQLTATLEAFAKADKKLVARAPDIVWGLFEPEPCLDPPPFTPSPTDSPELRRQLARARVALNTGHYPEGVEIAEPIVRDARAKGDRATELQAVLLLGQLTQHTENDQAGAQKWLHEAIAIAEAQGRDIDAASALSSLANLSAVDQHDYTSAHRFIDLARAKLARIGHGNTGAQAALLVTETQVLVDEVRFIEAEKTIRRAVELCEEAYGPDHPKYASALAVMSQVLRGANKTADSLGPARKASEIFAAAYGDEHPYVAGSRMNLATTLIDMEQFDEARAQLQKADAGFAKLYGNYHRYRAAVAGNLGELEMQQKHPEAALAAFQHALDVLEHVLGPESAEAAGAHRDIARALVALGKPAEALVHSQRDVAILDKSGKDNPRLPTAQMQLAEIELELGHPAIAGPAAERGLGLSEAQGADADPGELSRLRFALARALWDTGGDRSRARKLAEQAETGQTDPVRKAPITAWLADHPRP